jgi:hypothetical protein
MLTKAELGSKPILVKSFKIDGCRYNNVNLVKTCPEGTIIRKKVDEVLRGHICIRLNNTIERIEVKFTNDVRLTIDNPQNGEKLRLFTKERCFMIDHTGFKKENWYNRVGEGVQAAVVDVVDRYGNHDERRLKEALITKCGMTKMLWPVSSIIFRIDNKNGSKENWSITEPEMYEIDRQFYVIFGGFRMYRGKDEDSAVVWKAPITTKQSDSYERNPNPIDVTKVDNSDKRKEIMKTRVATGRKGG